MKEIDTEPGALDALGQPTHAQILSEIREMRRESKTWRREVFEPMASSVVSMRAELTRNTEVTEQVRDAANAFSFGKKAIVWIGGLAAGVVGIWQLVLLILRRGPDIGP